MRTHRWSWFTIWFKDWKPTTAPRIVLAGVALWIVIEIIWGRQS